MPDRIDEHEVGEIEPGAGVIERVAGSEGLLPAAPNCTRFGPARPYSGKQRSTRPTVQRERDRPIGTGNSVGGELTLAITFPCSSSTGSDPTDARYFTTRPPSSFVCCTVLSAGNGGNFSSSSFAGPGLGAPLPSSLVSVGASFAVANEPATRFHRCGGQDKDQRGGPRARE